MLKNKLLLLTLALGSLSMAQAQKLPTAEKLLDIQAGGSFVYGKSDYAHSEYSDYGYSDYGTTLKGYGGYGTIDFKPHFGVALDFHQAHGPDKINERTYEIGGRYVRHYGRINPYAKLMYGRGVFNFPPGFGSTESSGSLAYNLGAIGGGVDYKLRRSINIRADYEYQYWKNGPSESGPSGGSLKPWLASVGAAYHFH